MSTVEQFVEKTTIEVDFREQEIKNLHWFIDYLSRPGIDYQHVPDHDFALVIKKAVTEFSLDPITLADAFGVNKSTISRWSNGISSPKPFMRPTIIEKVKEEACAQLDGLEHR